MGDDILSWLWEHRVSERGVAYPQDVLEVNIHICPAPVVGTSSISGRESTELLTS